MLDIYCQCCGGKSGKLVYSGLTSVYSADSWSVVECTECRNIITSPAPEQKLLDKIYSSVYMYPVHLLALGEKKMRSRSLAAHIRKIYPPSKNKNVLEAGCMYGYLLNELKNDYNVKDRKSVV